MKEELKPLLRRIITISYELKLSHVGSCITALPIIAEIYKIKKPDEKFVLSAGHAHLAHAVVMEHFGIIKDAAQNIKDYGIHCERQAGCDVSTGSLGQGLPISVGIALSDKTKNVYCLVSDGELAEGSIWEALRIWKEQKLWNLKIYVNWNGWTAYQEANTDLYEMLVAFYPKVEIRKTTVDAFPFLQGQIGHYKIMSEKDYRDAIQIIEDENNK